MVNKKTHFIPPQKVKEFGKVRTEIDRLSVYDFEGDLEAILGMLNALRTSHSAGTIHIEHDIEYGYYDDADSVFTVHYTRPETGEERVERLRKRVITNKKARETQKQNAKKVVQKEESDLIALFNKVGKKRFQELKKGDFGDKNGKK